LRLLGRLVGLAIIVSGIATLWQAGDGQGARPAGRAQYRLLLVRAPFKGLVTNFNISVGDYAHIGECVLALVNRRMWYVVATSVRHCCRRSSRMEA
jgi:hypothetical protein